MFTSVQKTSLSGSVFEQLRELVLSGELPAGSDLPAERSLAETLGVNRSAVREGLKRAEQAGLISIQHGGNTRVLDFRRGAGPELLVELAGRDPQHLHDVRALRDALLPEIARTAAERATAAQIDRLEMLARLLHSDDAEQRRDLAAEFWDALVDASHNLAFRLVYNVIDRVEHGGPAPMAGDFAELANALAAGDTRGSAMAVEAMLG